MIAAGGLTSLKSGRGAVLLLALLSLQAEAMPLREAVVRGLRNNPDVRAADISIRAADTDVKIAKSGYYPTVSVSGGPRNFSFDDITYDVTASQMVHDWGRTASRVASARATSRQIAAEALVTRDAAALDIVEIYLDLMLAERLLEADVRHLERLGAVAEMTEARAAGGYSDRSEPARSSLEQARAVDQRARDEGQLSDMRHQFELLVGEAPAKLEEPALDPGPIRAAVADLDAVVPDAPLYKKALEDTHIAEAAVREARASQLPQLNLETSTLRRDLGGRAESDTMVGVRFRMSNIQGLSTFQRADAARQRLEAARWREGAVVRDIRRDVQNLSDATAMLTEREQALLTQIEGSGAIASLYQEQFQVGRRDVIDLLNVQREQFEAERQAIGVHIERLRMHYRMAAKLGLLDRLLGLEETSR